MHLLLEAAKDTGKSQLSRDGGKSRSRTQIQIPCIEPVLRTIAR
jgi:hypothetical protein